MSGVYRAGFVPYVTARNLCAPIFVGIGMSILARLFPETLFPRKLSADAEQRLRLAQARAEETLVRAHVDNALLFVDTLAPEVGMQRALDIYVRELALPDPLASVVVTRALVVLGEALVPRPDVGSEAHARPELRLDEPVAWPRRA